jgi:hypothetical protein
MRAFHVVVAGLLAANLGPLPAQSQPDPEKKPAPAARFDLDKPSRAFELPAELREVSAVTAVDEKTVACLQDEKGVLFLVDVRDGQVRAAHLFGPDGDYEGLARAGDEFWVLRSDGRLARLAPSDGGYVIAETFDLGLPNRDLEGLCFDPTTGLLLVAPKDVLETEKPKGKRGDAERERAKAQRDQRLVHGWDPRRRALLPEPVLELSIDDLVAQALERGDAVPMRTGKKQPERPALKLRFSCVAVEPRSGHLWLLSAVDSVLAVVDRQGRLQGQYRLDPAVLPKPEGLTFLPGGSLVLSSEGVGGPARLCVYEAKKE